MRRITLVIKRQVQDLMDQNSMGIFGVWTGYVGWRFAQLIPNEMCENIRIQCNAVQIRECTKLVKRKTCMMPVI